MNTTTNARWIAAKYAGKCSKCGEGFGRGKMVFYCRSTKTILVNGCAIAAADGVDAAARSYADVDSAYEDQCAEICGR